MSIVAGSMVPHPPLILPEVGHGEEAIIKKTTAAYKKVASFIADFEPDTIVLSSPHSTMYADYFHISPRKSAEGSFANFAAPQVQIKVNYDEEFVKTLSDMADENSFPAGVLGDRNPSLDHGTMVPLYFINQVYKNYKLVRIGLSGLSLSSHYRLGQMIQKVAKNLNRKIVYIASGDLSHKVKSNGPYGLFAEGVEYDRQIMQIMENADFGKLLGFTDTFLNKAAECGHRSFVILAGCLDGLKVKSNFLSYEGITGVGYGICIYEVIGEDKSRLFLSQWEKSQKEKIAKTRKNEDPYVALARATVESYIINGSLPSIPKDIPKEMSDNRAGVFVSIHKEGQLRGCIGTISATCNSIAKEIIQNAVSASTRDPRFPAIRPNELSLLDYSVDVLGEAETIQSASELDPNRYGVIVSNGMRRGLLLPMLDGVDTVEEQINIARQKAGIKVNEPIKLERFEVVRHK